VHIIKNAAKTTSKGKQSGREMAKDRGGICGKRRVDMDRYTRQGEVVQTDKASKCRRVFAVFAKCLLKKFVWPLEIFMAENYSIKVLANTDTAS